MPLAGQYDSAFRNNVKRRVAQTYMQYLRASGRESEYTEATETAGDVPRVARLG